MRIAVRQRKQLEDSIGHSTVTQNTIQQVLQWMKTCSKKHDKCQQYQQLAGAETGLPLRLIDVDPNGEYLKDYEPGGASIELLSCKDAPNVCIKHSREAMLESPGEIKYLTLSHRWSDASPTELNWDNMAELSVQIPIPSLTKTFKDAILITRCLGYIWIDSIRINQADNSEKASEISRMQSIYRHSQLNLSATSGESGLIFPRNPKSVLPVLQRKTRSGVQNIEADEDFFMVSACLWETNVDLGPLNERAWVVQERLLAPRVLHCCYNMVYWECACLRSSEVDPLGEVDYYAVTNMGDHHTNIKSDFVMASMSTDIVNDSFRSVDRFRLFHHIVRSYYFPKSLTISRDRLPAISGVAKWFMERVNLPPESYFAGLWEDALPECLLWHFNKPPKGEAVRDPEAGPSWSWASVISNSHIVYGNTQWSMHEPRPLFQNLQPIILPRNGDRFGQLEIAILRLQATVLPIEREWRDGAPHMSFPDENTWYPESLGPWSSKPRTIREKIVARIEKQIHYLACRLLNKPYSFELIKGFKKRTTRSYIEVRWDTTDMLWAEKTSYRPRQLYMIPIAWDRGENLMRDTGSWNVIIRGLILQRLPGQGQYGRVGMFMTANYDVYQNPGLSRGILRRMPQEALDSFSNRAFSRAPSLWQRVSQATIDLFRSGADQEGSNMTKTWVLPDDHLGISDNGLHKIEVI